MMHVPYESQHGEYLISTDPAKLDVAAIFRADRIAIFFGIVKLVIHPAGSKFALRRNISVIAAPRWHWSKTRYALALIAQTQPLKLTLEDLLAARRVLEPLLERVVLAERDDPAEEIDRAAASGVGGKPGARGGVVGAGRRGAAPGSDVAAGRVDRADHRRRGGGR